MLYALRIRDSSEVDGAMSLSGISFSPEAAGSIITRSAMLAARTGELWHKMIEPRLPLQALEFLMWFSRVGCLQPYVLQRPFPMSL